MNARLGRRESPRTTKLRIRIGQNCRAMCTNKSGLMPRAIGIRIARDALSNDQHESAAHFERPAKQALAVAIEPQREARGEVCSLSYLSVVW